jgi:hypothetical protein
VDYWPYEVTFARTRARLLQLDAVFRKFYRAKKLADGVPKIFFPGFAVSPHITVVRFHVTEAGVELLMHEKSFETVTLRSTYVVDSRIAGILAELEVLWQQVLDFIREQSGDSIFLHPAVNITWSGNEVVNAFVNKAYLEKCELGWWRLGDLLDHRRSQANASESEFRRLFLDNIAVIADHITKMEQAEDRHEAQGAREDDTSDRDARGEAQLPPGGDRRRQS